MPFDFHNRDRIDHLLEEIEELRYKDRRDLSGFCFWEDDGTIGNREPQGEGLPVELGFRWKGWDRYNWLTVTAEIPDAWKGQDILALFDFGARVGSGNNGDPESLLYINGKTYQAVDGNHHEVFLDVEKEGYTQEMKFRLWSGLSGGGVPVENVMELQQAQLAILDHPCDDLYYLAKAALETYDLLPANHEYKEWLLNCLVRCFTKVDFTEPGSEAFYESVKEAWNYLDGQMQGQGKPDINVSLIGHTHIDVAWLWRLRHTREKAARSFSTVNRLMEKYPEYLFLQTQPQLYDFLKEDYPDVYEHIKERVKEGKWEPAGAMWLECDCNIASGESIIRQILVGKNFFRKEFNYESEYLWLPDVFGYSWALPQILKKSGVDTFMTTKISWNDTNRLPYDTFRWRGMDGTEVTAHFVTTTDPGEDYYTYNGNTSPQAIRGVWEQYKNKDTNKDLLVSFGFGDGGGGPTRTQIKQAQMADRIPGLPHVKMEKPTDYFRRLNETMKENPMDGYIPVWDGELYLEFHRGTYTSQGYNKKMNRRMEYRLRNVEMEAMLAQVIKGVPYDYERILKAWKIVLCHQFHDILPGSSIKEVYEDSHVEYGRAIALLEEVCEAVEAALYEPKEGVYTVFNNSNWARSGEALIPMSEDEVRTYACGRVLDAEGEEVKSVWEKDGVRIWTKEIPSFAFASFRVEAGARETEKETIETSSIETPYYQIAWNEAGQLTRIFDKKAGREVLPEGKCANELQVFEDKPRCFDAWELEPTIDLKKEIVEDCTGVKVRQDAIGWQVDFTWKYHKSEIRQTMCLYEENPRIDFKTEVDWQERQKLLKTSFPVDVRAVDARFDIQDGNIRRPITRNTSWEAAKFEVAAHKWVDLWETGYGMAVLNDCKYGHDIKEDTIRLTLLKSAVEPDYTADLGTHSFTYAILPHSCEWYEAGIEQSAFALNNPLTAVKGKAALGQESWLSFDQDNLVVDAWKREENGSRVILRFHEFQGRRGEVTLHTRLAVKQWCECNLMEEPEAFKTGEIRVTLKPYEIKTLMFEI